MVEAMVAISILSLAVTGPLLIAQKGVGSAIYARDQITAFYLAQEAVEYVRNVRDSNRISKPAGNSWLYQFDECKEDGSGNPRFCQIDAQYSNFNENADAIALCNDVSNPAGPCPVLSFNSATGLYGYGVGGTWRPTMFTRSIFIDDRVSSKEALVSVTISWQTKLFTPRKTFNIREYIFDF